MKQSECVFFDSRSGKYGIRYYDTAGKLKSKLIGTKSREADSEIEAVRQNVKDTLRAGLIDVDQFLRLKAAAEAEGITLEKAIAKSRDGKGKCPILREFSKTFLEIKGYSEDKTIEPKAGLCKQKTVKNYKLLLDKHILPKLGDKRLSEINAGTLQGYVGQRTKEGYSAQTVNHELNLLSGLFLEARKAEILDHNPVHLVDRPAIKSGKPRWLSFEEETELLPRLSEPLKSAVIFSFETGLREQEQAKLTWADIDLDRRVIIVRDTKNGEDREVQMSDRVFDMMQAAKECRSDSPLKRYTDSPYVFTNAAPNLEQKTRYARFNNGPWRKALRDAGIKGYRWHDNRHTFASRLKQMGVDDAVVMELGGWKSISMVRRYAHLAPKNLEAGIKALGRWRAQAEADAKAKAEGA